jgi:predicted aminopeptidase
MENLFWRAYPLSVWRAYPLSVWRMGLSAYGGFDPIQNTYLLMPDPIYISFLFHQINQQRTHYCYLNGESADFSETITIGLYRLP